MPFYLLTVYCDLPYFCCQSLQYVVIIKKCLDNINTHICHKESLQQKVKFWCYCMTVSWLMFGYWSSRQKVTHVFSPLRLNLFVIQWHCFTMTKCQTECVKSPTARPSLSSPLVIFHAQRSEQKHNTCCHIKKKKASGSHTTTLHQSQGFTCGLNVIQLLHSEARSGNSSPLTSH